MRTFIICCNYNEERTGSLANCLASVRQNKLGDTYFAVADNGSKDGSAELLKANYQNGTINLLLLSRKNLGKPKILNMLLAEIVKREAIAPDDLIMSLDSDITLGGNGEFFSHAQALCTAARGNFSAMSVQLSDYNIHWVDFSKLTPVDFNGDKVYFWQNSDGVAGPVLITPYSTWSAIHGYRENCGKNGASSIYSADDCMLFRDAYAHTGGKPIMISAKLISRHPETKDKAYQAWKDETNRLLNLGFGNSMLPEKGFYDD